MNGLRNWYYKDLIELLNFFGFKFSYQKGGSHEIWKNDQKQEVEVYNSNNERVFPPGGLFNILKKVEIPIWVARGWSKFTKKKKKEIKKQYKLGKLDLVT